MNRLNLGFFAMIIGMFMAILDIQIVASSIQQIQAGVSASADEIAWVQTGYLIAEVVGIPLSGLLNRALSMRWLFICSSAGFVLSSMLCGFSWDLGSLIFFRCIQGFLGAAMIPTTMTAAFSLFGPNRSMVQQVLIGLVATMAPSIGPTLGGWITETFSWRWLFFINVVPGIVSATLVYLYIPKGRPQLDLIRRIDIFGLIAMAAFLGSLEYVLEKGPSNGWLEDEAIQRWLLVCVVSGPIFFWRALTRENPVVDLRAFQDRNFLTGSFIASTIGFGLFGSVFLTPLFLGQVRGYSSLQIGEIMSVAGLAMLIAGPTSGILIRKIDPRFVLASGLAFCALGVWLNARLTAQSSFEELFFPQILRGAGLMMAMIPTNFLALGTVSPAQLPNASGLFTVARNMGGAFGLAWLNTMRLQFTNLHMQELGSAMDPTRPDVHAYLAQSEARLAAAGSANPHGQAMGQLMRRMQLEANVMTFNNLFLAMSICFVVMLMLVPLIKKPPPRTGPPQPSH